VIVIFQVLSSEQYLLDVCNDMSALGLLLQVSTLGAHDEQQLLRLVVFGHFKRPLDHLVRLNVPHQLHDLDSWFLEEFGNDFPPLVRTAIDEALLDHVGGLLGQTHGFDLPSDCVEHPLILGLGKFEHMLDGLVSLLVFAEIFDEWQYFINYRFDQLRIAMFKHALDHSAALGVNGQAVAVALEGSH